MIDAIHEYAWFHVGFDPAPVGSIVQAAAALRFLGTHRDEAGMTAIARALDIGPSSCFKVLRTLVLEALEESEAATRIHMVVGQRQPAAAGATGRAVITSRRLGDAGILSAFASARWQNAPTATGYITEIRDTETRDFAVDIDQINRGIATVAAVILDDCGQARFVLSASMFAGRDVAMLDHIGQRLRDSARALSQTFSRAA